MTEGGEVSLSSNGRLLTLEIAVEMDVFYRFTLGANNMVVMLTLNEFITLDVVMEIDRTKNVSLHENI